MTKIDEKLRHIYYDIDHNSASLSGNANVLAKAAGTSVAKTEKWNGNVVLVTLSHMFGPHFCKKVP